MRVPVLALLRSKIVFGYVQYVIDRPIEITMGGSSEKGVCIVNQIVEIDGRRACNVSSRQRVAITDDRKLSSKLVILRGAYVSVSKAAS